MEEKSSETKELSDEEIVARLNYNYVEEQDDGTKLLTRVELGRQLVEKTGPYIVMSYLYRELKRSTGTFGTPKVSIVRYQKRINKRTGESYYIRACHYAMNIYQVKNYLAPFMYWIDHSIDINKKSEADPKFYDPTFASDRIMKDYTEDMRNPRKKRKRKVVW